MTLLLFEIFLVKKIKIEKNSYLGNRKFSDGFSQVISPTCNKFECNYCGVWLAAGLCHRRSNNISLTHCMTEIQLVKNAKMTYFRILTKNAIWHLFLQSCSANIYRANISLCWEFDRPIASYCRGAKKNSVTLLMFEIHLVKKIRNQEKQPLWKS